MSDLVQVGITLVATLAAAFLGAFSAFLLEERRRAQQKRNDNIAAANRALYTIYNMWNVLRSYEIEAIEAFQDEETAWLNMPAHPVNVYGMVSFEGRDLAFLMELGEAQLFVSILMEEQRFQINTGLIEFRSKVLIDYVHPRFDKAGIPPKAQALPEDLIAIMGPNYHNQLVQLTEGIIRNTRYNLKSLPKVFAELRSTMKRVYNAKFFDVEFDSNEKLTDKE